jgi:DNA-binding NarL/FixJ family response regulator
VVDGDPLARQAVAIMLAPEGLDLRLAGSGAEALSILNALPIDLVISEVRMPEMSGFDLCRSMKAHPEWRFVPVILLTGLNHEENVIEGLEVGADDFLIKPVVGGVLRARTRAMLRVRQQYTALRGCHADANTLLQRRKERLVTAADLTKREVEVLDLLLLGRSHEDIALVLGISERTSKFHQGNLLRKLGADSRFDLVRLFT